MSKNKDQTMKVDQAFNPFGMFRGIFLPNKIAMSSLSDRGKLLLSVLYSHTKENGECYPSISRLAVELGWSNSKVDRAIKDLKIYGLIKTYQIDAQSPYSFIFYDLYQEVL